MEISIVALWAQMGIAAKVVVVSLSVMAIVTIAVTVDRFLAMARWRRDKKPEDADTLETIRALLDS